VNAVAWHQRSLQDRIAQFLKGGSGEPGSAAHGPADAFQSLPHAPALGAGELDDQHVVDTARFYAEQLLPQTKGLVPQITAGGASVLAGDLSAVLV